MVSVNKFNEKSLPHKENFYSESKQNEKTDEEYKQALNC